MKLRTGNNFDFPSLSSQVKASSDEDLLSHYHIYQAALKSAEHGKLIEPGAAELADQLVAAKSAGALRDLLADEFEVAGEKIPPAPLSTDEPEPRMKDFADGLKDGETYEIAIERYIARREQWRERWYGGPPRGRLQWAIIWGTVLTAAHFWLDLDLSRFWSPYGGHWGLDGYVYSAYTDHRPEFAFVILVIGALLLFQVSAGRSGKALARWLANISTKTLVIACLGVLLVLVALHFRTATQPTRSYRYVSPYGNPFSAAYGDLWDAPKGRKGKN